MLAAGLGTRMRSERCKVLHPLAGRPLVAYALRVCAEIGARPVVVLSRESEPARAVLPDDAIVAMQETQRGTGDALRVGLAAAPAEARLGWVIYGDTPLLLGSTLRAMAALLRERGAVLALLGGDAGAANEYGRIETDGAGEVLRIVEHRLATPNERALPESNFGAYAVDLAWLRRAIHRLRPNQTGEIFLTDLVEIARGDGRRVVAHHTERAEEGMGVNTRVDLAAAEQAMARRIRERHMLAGVTFRNPESTLVDDEVAIEPDVTIEPGTILQGKTRIGRGSRIGPYAILRDTVVGERCRVEASVLEGATLEADVVVGPYSHLRPGAYLEQGVAMGNFGEVKAARLRKGTKMHHFSYIGDADIGERVNIGAGTITLNYDGVAKHRTEIGNDAFIGSDTLLRAPIRVGEGAATGAGAVVTKDVPDGMLAVGMPARAIKKVTRKGGGTAR